MYPLEQASLLAKIGDARAVVVGEHLVTEDCVCNLRSMNEVHLQETCLKGSLLGLVVLEGVEQERSGRLDHVLRHEDVDHLHIGGQQLQLSI